MAIGGGGFSMEPDNTLIDDHVLDLARRVRGSARPRVCFLATASGDAPGYIADYYAAFALRAEATHLALFESVSNIAFAVAMASLFRMRLRFPICRRAQFIAFFTKFRSSLASSAII